LPDLTFDVLKTKQRALREGFPSDLGLRVHRSISWIGRSEREEDDPDARFIFLWIAFNAAYANDEVGFTGTRTSARRGIEDYFDKLVALDTDHTIYDALWTRFAGPIRMLMGNPFVYSPFWSFHNGADGYDDWEDRFRRSDNFFRSAFTDRRTVQVLSCVFDRLYVLRNQIMHGGATWNGSVNRDQVRDGAAILGFLVPVFAELMMDHPHDEWGSPSYPVVDLRASDGTKTA
jgi:hypothetical protein